MGVDITKHIEYVDEFLRDYEEKQLTLQAFRKAIWELSIVEIS